MTERYSIRRWVNKGLLVAVMVLQLTGCNPFDDEETYTGTFSGSVGDGPVTGATVDVYNSAGALLGTIFSDSNATYSVPLKTKGSDYPLRLIARGGTDLVTGSAPDFDMVSVISTPSSQNANINPFSTLIVKVAESMHGGMNNANVRKAKGYVMGSLGFGLDEAAVPDPITTTVNNGNVAHIVKASETMGEMVRRTRDLLAGSGMPVDGDSVLDMLGSDLVDGVLDGQGGTAANASVAAVANVVSGQVLLEAASNNLKVGGAIATSVLDMSIISTHANVTGYQLTSGVQINSRMLNQLNASLAAIQVLDQGQGVANIVSGVATLSAGMLPGQVNATLPVSQSLVLNNALALAPTATLAEISAINDAAANGSPGTGTGNTAPQISGAPAAIVTAGNAYNFQPSAFDADGDALAYAISNRPSWASFNTSTGRLSGTPADQHAGTYSNVVITVSDGTDTGSLAPFTIQVNAAPVTNTAPVISGNAAGSVFAGSSYVFQPSASDADGDNLSFSISNRPSWASFNTSSGRLSGTPAAQHVGSYGNIVITVSDGTDTDSLAPFTVLVNPAPVTNTAPVISGSPAGSVFSNSSYVFQPSAFDADGDNLSFSISNRPSWASFNTSSGRLSGTPGDQHAGTYGNITIRVSDGTATVSLPGFSILVEAAPVVNTPPVINGSAAGLVTAGNGYAFQPVASDADGDALTFSISNRPSWANFNTSTGRLSGTPSSNQTGFYGNIVISVSDGTDTVSLPAFSIQVDPSLGSFTLSWTAPAARADGTALQLSEISEYRIYYGPAPGNYTGSITVNNGSATSAVISNVQSGTWYAAMTTVDTNGMESSQSGAVQKTAN